MATFHRRLPLLAERASLAFGLLGLVIWAALFFGTARSAQHDLDRFATLQARSLDEAPDFSLWSTQRVFAWRKAMKEPFPAPLAVLRIPKLRLEVAVLPGTDDATLDRGLGHIEDTALPGADGNSGIAGHRDGFFRGLKDILPGDTIEVDTLDAEGNLSRRANVDRRSNGCVGPGPNAVGVADARHLLPLLLRRLRTSAIHRSCRPRRRRTFVLARP